MSGVLVFLLSLHVAQHPLNTMDRSILQGIELFHAKAYQQAWDALEPATHATPLIENRTVAQARLLGAWSLIALKHYEEALRILEETQSYLSDVSHVVWYCKGSALLGLGQWQQAKEAFSNALTAFPNTSLKGDVYFGLAQASEHMGHVSKAKTYYEEASHTVRNPHTLGDVAYALASLEEREKRWENALKWYQFFIHRTDHSKEQSDAVFSKIRSLESNHSHKSDVFAQHLKHLDGLLSARSLDKAYLLIEKLETTTALSDIQALQLQQRKALWHDRKGQKEEAVSVLKQLASSSIASIRSESEKTLARVLASMKQPLLAIDMYLSHHNDPSYQFKAAHTALTSGMYDDAAALFLDHYVRYKKAASRDEVLWYASWSAYKAGHLNEALRLFTFFHNKHPTSSLKERVVYWQAHVLDRQNQKEKAHALYQSLALQPVSYYGILASKKIRSNTATAYCDSLKSEDIALPPWGDNIFIWSSLEAKRFLQLLEMGFEEDASEAAKHIPTEKNTAKQDILYARARLAFALGDHHYAHTALTLHAPHMLADPYQPKNRPYFYMAYPKAFEATVRKASRDFSLPSEMVWAVMKQESEFRTKARSQASAHGLMQIIPTTGENIAKALQHPSFYPVHLSDPMVNIRFGAWYLKQLSAMFEHNMGLVAAAYNAGPFQVASWVEQRPHLPMDEFIEDIPFKETRHYVKRVLSYLHTYRYLYGICPNEWPVDSGRKPTTQVGF